MESLKLVVEDTNESYLTSLESLLAEIHHNLGCIGTETNDPAGALRHFEAFKDLVLQEKTDDSSKTNLRKAIAWNELGNAWMLNKEWKKGEECFLRAIDTTKEVQGYDPTDMSFPMVNLGLAYWNLGKLDEAAAILLEGLRARESKFGKDDRVSFM